MSNVKKCDKCRKIIDTGKEDCNSTNEYITLSRHTNPMVIDGQELTVEVKVLTSCGQNYDLCDTCMGKIIIAYVKTAFNIK